MKSFFSGIREIWNWIWLLRTLGKISKDKEFQEHNLRYDWVGRIYTVVNLGKQDIGEEESIRRIRIIDMIKDKNLYLTSQNLSEIIALTKPERVSDIGYLVVYIPIFNYVGFWWFIKLISIILLFVYHSRIYHLAIQLYHIVKGLF